MSTEYDTRCSVCEKQEDRPAYIGYFDMKDIFSCDAHYDELYTRYIARRPKFVCDLHQKETWTHRDKKTDSLKKHSLSRGKSWEIEHRTLADDGKTVINSATGKPSEY